MMHSPQLVTESDPEATDTSYANLNADNSPSDPGTMAVSSESKRRFHYEVSFALSALESFDPERPIALPDLRHYVHPSVSEAITKTLSERYATVCGLLTHCMRFSKKEEFWDCINYFMTILERDLPQEVRQLVDDPHVAVWIRDSDWKMYQNMMRLLAPRIFEFIPTDVLQWFKDMSKTLPSRIEASSKSRPRHLTAAKMIPAKMFAMLLGRLVRVNEAARGAAGVLSEEDQRNRMYKEWRDHVDVERIVSSVLLDCKDENSDLVEEMMVEHLGGLFQLGGQPSGQSNGNTGESEPPDEGSNDDFMSKWDEFIRRLPTRFPDVKAQTLIVHFNAITAAVLRDISIAGGQSFGSWWLVSTMLNELLAFYAELGGFMRCTTASG